MKTKICSMCKKEKPLVFFTNDKNRLDKKYVYCKDCLKIRYELNKKSILKKAKDYYLKNKKELSRKQNEYYNLNKEEIKSKNIKLRKSKQIKKICHICKKTFSTNYSNKKYCSKKCYHIAYEILHKITGKIYRVKNKQKIYNKNAKYRKIKYKADLNYRILCCLRTRVLSVLKGFYKSKSTLNLLGCSIDFLKQHLQSQFKKGMSWDNYGINGWEIDHIIPCASFDLRKIFEQTKCFNYKNLQPLWKLDNIKKSDKIIGENK
jgi:protein-arginine kinase activator protein McsA